MKTSFRKYLILLFCIVLTAPVLKAQYGSKKYSVGIYYNYTISSKLYNKPRDPDFYLREQYETIDYQRNFSVDFRYWLTKSVGLGFGGDYLKSSSVVNPVEGIAESGAVVLPADDAYELFAFELSVYYMLPFSGEKFKFFMGGGVGTYFGNHIRNIYGVGIENIEREYDFGIHVIVGMDYMINEYIAVRGQMKFRDPQFEIKSRYLEPSVVVDDEQVLIRQDSFYSKVNADGIIFALGISFLF